MTPDEQAKYVDDEKSYILSIREAARGQFSEDKRHWDKVLAKAVGLSSGADFLPLAKELKQQGGYWDQHWNINALAGWLRHAGRCVYCNKDLTACADVLYGQSCSDHLVPRFQNMNLENAPLNWVPACQWCNNIKSRHERRRRKESSGSNNSPA
jgi:hypothetical protein